MGEKRVGKLVKVKEKPKTFLKLYKQPPSSLILTVHSHILLLFRARAEDRSCFGKAILRVRERGRR